MSLLRRRTSVQVVTLVTRSGCHLCELAHPVVAQAAADAGVRFEVLDVDADPAPMSDGASTSDLVPTRDAASRSDAASWSDKVPVVLLDGVEHAYWQVDRKALRRALGLRV